MSPGQAHAPSGRSWSASVGDWQRKAYTSMYPLLNRSSRRRISGSEFVAEFQEAAQIATLRRFSDVHVLSIGPRLARVSVTARTTVFGALHKTLEVRWSEAAATRECASAARCCFEPETRAAARAQVNDRSTRDSAGGGRAGAGPRQLTVDIDPVGGRRDRGNAWPNPRQ